MYLERKISRVLISTVLLFVVNSCAVLKLPPPDHDIKTILVLPFKVTDKAVETRTRGYGFNYGYEIVDVDDENIKYEVIFALSNKEEILIIDSIPPGYYFVNKLNVFPRKAGARVNNKKAVLRYDNFKLVSGKITIFPLSLNILVEESPGGRRYFNKMSLVEWRQKDQIIKKLKELENFDKWKIASSKNLIINQMQGQWAGSWSASTEIGNNGISCSNGKTRFEIKGYKLRGQGTSSRGDLYDVTASISEAGAIEGSFMIGNQHIAKISGGYFSGGEVSGAVEDIENCKGRWEALQQ